ncbi:hypothetical protein Tco_0817087 [Tanacetum coccineum]
MVVLRIASLALLVCEVGESGGDIFGWRGEVWECGTNGPSKYIVELQGWSFVVDSTLGDGRNAPSKLYEVLQIVMSSASSAVTYTSVYTDSEPGRAFWGADDEEVSEGGIPRVIVLGYDGLPIQPVAPPSPDYIPGLNVYQGFYVNPKPFMIMLKKK